MIHPGRSFEHQPQTISNFTVKLSDTRAAPVQQHRKMLGRPGNSGQDRKIKKSSDQRRKEGRSPARAGSFLIKFRSNRVPSYYGVAGGQTLVPLKVSLVLGFCGSVVLWFCGSVALWLLWSSFDSLHLSSIDAYSYLYSVACRTWSRIDHLIFLFLLLFYPFPIFIFVKTPPFAIVHSSISPRSAIIMHCRCCKAPFCRCSIFKVSTTRNKRGVAARNAGKTPKNIQ